MSTNSETIDALLAERMDEMVAEFAEEMRERARAAADNLIQIWAHAGKPDVESTEFRELLAAGIFGNSKGAYLHAQASTIANILGGLREAVDVVRKTYTSQRIGDYFSE